MSELRLTGDTDKTLGQFLPAPYVEKIVLYGNPVESDTNNRFVVRTNFMVPNDSETTIYNSGVDSVKSAYKEQLEDLHYYIMYFYVNSDKASSLTDDDPDGVYNQRLPIKYYDQIINGDINPFRAYYVYAQDLNDVAPEGSYSVSLNSFDPLSSDSPTVAFDEAGNEFLNYAHDESIYLPNYDNWVDAAELRFIIFTSTKTYEDVEANGDIEDLRMLNIITGDISYETIYQNSELGDPERTRFVDTNDEIYQEVPLLDLGSVPHKLASVTQDDIVNNFQQLLDQYSTQYNSDTGFVIMKKMMDNISVILNTMADSPGILVSLQQLVPTFPDKTPSKPIGKFYKSFRKRLFNFNNSIKTGEILRRKVVYDSKIIDLRTSENINLIGGEFIQGVEVPNFDLISTTANYVYAYNYDLLSRTDSLSNTATNTDEILSLSRTDSLSNTDETLSVEELTQQAQELYDQAAELDLQAAIAEGEGESPELVESLRSEAESLREEAESLLSEAEVEAAEVTTPELVNNADRFIYSSNLIKEYKVTELTSELDPSEFLTINFGYFFFDYEKALKKTSNIAKVFNVSKLEAFGLPVSYRNFSLKLASVSRGELSVDDGVVTSDAAIHCTFSDVGYPKTQRVYTEQASFENRENLYYSPYDVYNNADSGIEFTDLIDEQPYAPSNVELPARYGRINDLNDGVVSILIVRPFTDVSNVNNGYGIGASGNSNYRLTMFQVLDYIWNTEENQYGQYTAEIYVIDKTNKMLYDLINDFYSKFSDLEIYYEYAQEICAFNNNTQKFNDFFLEEVEQIYGDDPSNYPWITAPIAYHLHLDLLYNLYDGNLDVIKKKASDLSNQISPGQGTLTSLEAFLETMETIYNDVYRDYLNESSDDYVVRDEEKINVYYENIIFETQTTTQYT